MVELVDTPDSKSGSARSVGSSPTLPTNRNGGCKSPKQKDTAIKLNYQTQVYPLTLIRCRNGNWLHRGSSPLTWTIRLICIFKLQNNFNFNCFAHLGGFDKSSYWWFPCSIDKNKENFDCYTFMVCLLFDL